MAPGPRGARCPCCASRPRHYAVVARLPLRYRQSSNLVSPEKMMQARPFAVALIAGLALVACDQKPIPEPDEPPTCVTIPSDHSPTRELGFCYGVASCIPLPASAVSPGQREICFDSRSWEGTKYIWRKTNDTVFGILVDGKSYVLHYQPDSTYEPGRNSLGAPVAGGKFRIRGILVTDSSIVVSRETYLSVKRGANPTQEIILRRQTPGTEPGFVETTASLSSYAGRLKGFTPLISGAQGTGVLTRIVELHTDNEVYQLVYAPGATILEGLHSEVRVRGVPVEKRLLVVFEQQPGSK